MQLDKLIEKYDKLGEIKFYNFIIVYSIKNSLINEKISPEMYLLYYHDNLLKLYRKTNNNKYLELAKLLRRAAHKVYRIYLKNNLINKNDRFLNILV